MQSNGGSSNFACFESVLGADWPGSIPSFVSHEMVGRFREMAAIWGCPVYKEDVEDNK